MVALDINGPAVEETAAEAASELITPLVMDLTMPGAADLAVMESLEALGGLDIVVNNAGWGVGEAFLAMTEASWDRTLDLNLKAVALICAAAGRHMKERGSGRIINVTSPASRMALPNYLAYAASKAGVDAVTRAAAFETGAVWRAGKQRGAGNDGYEACHQQITGAATGGDRGTKRYLAGVFTDEENETDPIAQAGPGCGDGGGDDRLAGVGCAGLHYR